MLNIVNEIKAFGLDFVVANYSLVCKKENNKVLLKYHQIDSHFARGTKAVRECRGLILEEGTWKVMSLPFVRFFNLGENHADDIDYDTAKTFKKEDGSLIALYWDWNQEKWCIQTSGTIEANTPVGLDSDLTFFKLACNTMDFEVDENGVIQNFKGNKNFIYVMELCTPYNVVVTPHKTCYTRVLTIRNRETLKELSWENVIIESETVGLKAVECYGFNPKDVVKMAKDLPQVEEGYIVCDGNFNRVKVKNPAYVALHHLKSKLCKEELFTVIFKGEQDEFLTLFPEYTDMLYDRIEWLDIVKKDVQNVHKDLKLSAPTDSKKSYAIYLQGLMKTYPLSSHFASYFYRMFDNDMSIDMLEVIKNTDVKNLNKGFQKWK